MKCNAIEKLLQNKTSNGESVNPNYNRVLCEDNEVANVLTSGNPLLDDTTLLNRKIARNKLGKFQIVIGSTNGTNRDTIIDEDNSANTSNSSGYFE